MSFTVRMHSCEKLCARNTTLLEDALYVHPRQIPRLEKFIRLHFELAINLEEIEAMSHMLERLEKQHGKITRLRNSLRLFK
jgi:hypothetical protein